MPASIPSPAAAPRSWTTKSATHRRLKCLTEDWLGVHRTAHQLGMRTTATMMFGCGEKLEHRINHFQHVYDLQEETGGFTAFIPWTFQPQNTALGGRGWDEATAVEYLKTLAISRLFLSNISNVQASWVTQGLKVLQLGLRFGGNDVGVSHAGRECGESGRRLELHHGRGAAAHHPRRRIPSRAARHALPDVLPELTAIWLKENRWRDVEASAEPFDMFHPQRPAAAQHLGNNTLCREDANQVPLLEPVGFH